MFINACENKPLISKKKCYPLFSVGGKNSIIFFQIFWMLVLNVVLNYFIPKFWFSTAKKKSTSSISKSTVLQCLDVVKKFVQHCILSSNSPEDILFQPSKLKNHIIWFQSAANGSTQNRLIFKKISLKF